MPLCNRILLVGWGAADWQVLEPMLARGDLPVLRRLMETGAHGRLDSLQPLETSLLWTSLATGKVAETHGIFNALEPQADGYDARPTASTSRRCKALWNILSQSEKRALVIGWPSTYPAEPIDGLIVCPELTRASAAGREDVPAVDEVVHPETVFEELAALCQTPDQLTPEQVLTFLPEARRVDQSRDARFARLVNTVCEMLSIHNVTTAIMESESWDVLMTHQPATLLAGREFMRYSPPKHESIDDRDFEIYGSVMTLLYRFHDAMLARLLELAGAETTVIVSSVHGLASSQRPPRKSSEKGWDKAHGILCMAGPGIQEGARIFDASILDIVPTVLRLLGLPRAEDLDGRVLTESLNGRPDTASDLLDSWEDVPGRAGLHPQDKADNALDSAGSIAHLLDLGYEEKADPRARDRAVRAERMCTLNRALALTATGHQGKALELLETLFEQAPESIMTGYMLATAYLNDSRMDDCERVLGTLVDRCLDLKQRKLNRLEKVRQRFTELGGQRAHEARSGSHPGGITDSDTVADQFSRIDESVLRYLESFEMHDPAATPHALMLRAAIALNRDNTTEALDLLEQIERTGSHSHSLQMQVGKSYLKLRRWERAATAYETALTSEPDSAPAHNGLSAALLRMNKLEQAMEHALTAVELKPTNPYSHFVLGASLSKHGRADEAAEALRTTLHLHPDNMLARRLLLRVYQHQLGRADLAAEQQVEIALLRAKRRQLANQESPSV